MLTELKTERCSFCPRVVEGSSGLLFQLEYPSGQDAFHQDQVFRSSGDIAWVSPWLRALLPVHSVELKNLLDTMKMFSFGFFFSFWPNNNFHKIFGILIFPGSYRR